MFDYNEDKTPNYISMAIKYIQNNTNNLKIDMAIDRIIGYIHDLEKENKALTFKCEHAVIKEKLIAKVKETSTVKEAVEVIKNEDTVIVPIVRK